jgi:hypothetical protein
MTVTSTAATIKHCPTCNCQLRRRFTIDDTTLAEVAEIYRAGGIPHVADVTNRSRSQAYRLVARAKDAGWIDP